MVAILEEPDIRQMVTLMTVETYHRLSELGPDVQPVELIRGVVIDKIDKMSRSQLHIYLIRRLYDLLLDLAKTAEVFVIKEDPLTLGDSEPEPDLAVIAGRRRDFDHVRLTTALLTIEVAVTSLGLDHAKADLYAEADIPEYWIVLAKRDAVEVYTAPVNGVYTQCRTYRRGETLQSATLPALHVEIDALFAK